MKSAQKFLLATILGLLLSTSTLLADTMSPKDIAKKVYDALDNQTTYAFNAIVVNHSDEGKNQHNVSVKVNRPNQLRVDVTGDIRNRSNYMNNGLYTIYDHDKNYYIQIDTPKSIETTLDAIFDTFEIKVPLAQLIYTNMGERIKFDRSKNFGIVDLEGTECHYIAFSDKTSKNNAYKSTTIYWKDAKTVSATDFTFTAPKNAEEVFID